LTAEDYNKFANHTRKLCWANLGNVKKWFFDNIQQQFSLNIYQELFKL